MIAIDFALFFTPGCKLIQHHNKYYLQVTPESLNTCRYYLEVFHNQPTSYHQQTSFYWSEITQETYNQLTKVFTTPK